MQFAIRVQTFFLKKKKNPSNEIFYQFQKKSSWYYYDKFQTKNMKKNISPSSIFLSTTLDWNSDITHQQTKNTLFEKWCNWSYVFVRTSSIYSKINSLTCNLTTFCKQATKRAHNNWDFTCNTHKISIRSTVLWHKICAHLLLEFINFWASCQNIKSKLHLRSQLLFKLAAPFWTSSYLIVVYFLMWRYKHL